MTRAAQSGRTAGGRHAGRCATSSATRRRHPGNLHDGHRRHGEQVQHHPRQRDTRERRRLHRQQHEFDGERGRHGRQSPIAPARGHDASSDSRSDSTSSAPAAPNVSSKPGRRRSSGQTTSMARRGGRGRVPGRVRWSSARRSRDRPRPPAPRAAPTAPTRRRRHRRSARAIVSSDDASRTQPGQRAERRHQRHEDRDVAARDGDHVIRARRLQALAHGVGNRRAIANQHGGRDRRRMSDLRAPTQRVDRTRAPAPARRAAASSSRRPASSTSTSSALFTEPRSVVPSSARSRSKSGTPSSRYRAGRRNVTGASMVRPAVQAATRSAGAAPLMLRTTVPAAACQPSPSRTSRTATRRLDEAVARRRVLEHARPACGSGSCGARPARACRSRSRRRRRAAPGAAAGRARRRAPRSPWPPRTRRNRARARRSSARVHPRTAIPPRRPAAAHRTTSSGDVDQASREPGEHTGHSAKRPGAVQSTGTRGRMQGTRRAATLAQECSCAVRSRVRRICNAASRAAAAQFPRA